MSAAQQTTSSWNADSAYLDLEVPIREVTYMAGLPATSPGTCSMERRQRRTVTTSSSG
jgi:hypothetical protein